MAHQHSEFRNILVIHFGQLGDVVLGLPVLQAIRERFVKARITLLIGKAPDGIVKLADVADDYIVVDRVELRDGKKLRSIAAILRLVRDIRRRRFDLVVDLHSLSETNILGFVAGIPNRLYSNRESRSLDRLANFKPPPPLEDKQKHLTERYFDVVKPIGIEPTGTTFKLVPTSEDIVEVSRRFPGTFGAGERPLVGLFPGAGNPSRCWPLENFKQLAVLIADAGFRPVVFLGPEESSLKETVIGVFPAETEVIDGLNLPQFVAAVSKMSVFVANDTGPIHLAACAGVPVVLILDERAPTTYLPLTEKLEIVSGSMIEKIEVGSAFEAVRSIVSGEK